jgi:hypothetical protein
MTSAKDPLGRCVKPPQWRLALQTKEHETAVATCRLLIGLLLMKFLEYEMLLAYLPAPAPTSAAEPAIWMWVRASPKF